MKRVDQMIKYLSGDLSPEESHSFERELAGDPQLKEEFSQVSSAYQMIGDQLRKRDEEAFTSALNASIKKAGTLKSPRNKRPGLWLSLLVGMAASLAILVHVFGPGRSTEKIYSAWYIPSEDPVIQTIKEETRGKTVHALARLWQEEEFERCGDLASLELSKDPENQYAMLFCLLSSMEMDGTEPWPQWLKSADIRNENPLQQAITWYHALSLIRAGKSSEAAQLLTVLEELPGPYKRDAHKLKKMLKK
jgi:hypothetical protein